MSQRWKFERCDTLGFLKLQFGAKYQKAWSGDPLETKKFEKKSFTVPKNSNGAPYILVRVLYLTLKTE